MTLSGNDVEMQAKSESHLLGMWVDRNELPSGLIERVQAEIERRGLDTHPTVHKPMDEFPRVLITIGVAVVGGVAFFIFMSGLAWTVMHNVSDFGLYIYFALWLGGTPTVALLAAWLTNRALSK